MARPRLRGTETIPAPWKATGRVPDVKQGPLGNPRSADSGSSGSGSASSGAKQIDYNSDDLSGRAFEIRDNGGLFGADHNVAVADVEGKDGTIREVSAVNGPTGHSEQKILDKLKEGDKMWVRKILEFVGRESVGIPVDWEAIEREIGAPLPPDCKELSEAFGGDLFSDTVTFLACDENQAFDLVTRWRSALAADRDPRLGDVSAVTPYKIYEPGGEGLISWGSTEWGDEYFWLINSAESGKWPILARAGDIDQWHTFDMSTSEFLYRVLTDTDFRPFGIAQHALGATFEPGYAL